MCVYKTSRFIYMWRFKSPCSDGSRPTCSSGTPPGRDGRVGANFLILQKKEIQEFLCLLKFHLQKQIYCLFFYRNRIGYTSKDNVVVLECGLFSFLQYLYLSLNDKKTLIFSLFVWNLSTFSHEIFSFFPKKNFFRINSRQRHCTAGTQNSPRRWAWLYGGR